MDLGIITLVALRLFCPWDFQARMEWVFISSSRGCFPPRDCTWSLMSPALASGFFTTIALITAWHSMFVSLFVCHLLFTPIWNMISVRLELFFSSKSPESRTVPVLEHSRCSVDSCWVNEWLCPALPCHRIHVLTPPLPLSLLSTWKPYWQSGWDHSQVTEQ